MEANAKLTVRANELKAESSRFNALFNKFIVGISHTYRTKAGQAALYAQAAKQCGCSTAVIDHSVRKSAERAWSRSRGWLEDIAGYPLDGRPSAKQFVEIVAAYCLREERLMV